MEKKKQGLREKKNVQGIRWNLAEMIQKLKGEKFTVPLTL